MEAAIITAVIFSFLVGLLAGTALGIKSRTKPMILRPKPPSNVIRLDSRKVVSLKDFLQGRNPDSRK